MTRRRTLPVARRALCAALQTEQTHAEMFSLSVKPCLQQHKWSLYLNAPSFTTTVILDCVPVEVTSDEKVSAVVDKLQRAVGMSSRANRRVEGFQEDWVKVVHRGQQLDPELSWKEVGIESDGASISVVWKELAAEGALLQDPLRPQKLSLFLPCPTSLAWYVYPTDTLCTLPNLLSNI